MNQSHFEPTKNYVFTSLGGGGHVVKLRKRSFVIKSSDGQQNSTAILGSTPSFSDTAESDVRRV